jgi:hypothetical protein
MTCLPPQIDLLASQQSRKHVASRITSFDCVDLKKATMGRAKTWSSIEAEVAAKAFVSATHDSIVGSGQKADEFAKKVHEEFAKLSPPGVAGTGTYTDRDPDGTQGIVWKYIRDTILKDVQKFNATLNIVMNSGLSGVTHEEKVNIAVAMLLKKMKEGENKYDYRSFEAKKKWRLYRAWTVLKDTEKVAPPREVRHPTDEVSESEADSNEGFITDSSAGASNNQGLNSTTKGKEKRFTYQGRDAAKREEQKIYQMEKRIKALDSIAETEKSKLKVIRDLKLQVQAQNMIAMLSHPSIQGNEVLSNRMMARIMSIMGMEENKNPLDDSAAKVAEEVADEIVDEMNNQNSDDENEEEEEFEDVQDDEN